MKRIAKHAPFWAQSFRREHGRHARPRNTVCVGALPGARRLAPATAACANSRSTRPHDRGPARSNAAVDETARSAAAANPEEAAGERGCSG